MPCNVHEKTQGFMPFPPFTTVLRGQSDNDVIGLVIPSSPSLGTVEMVSKFPVCNGGWT